MRSIALAHGMARTVGIVALAWTALLALAAQAAEEKGGPVASAPLPDFALERLNGSADSLGAYRGKVLLVVNVASECGYTPQYAGLQALYERYRDRGFTILGFPSNDFGKQEPGSNEEIAKFCRANYGVEFPMFSKCAVLGEAAHPLYRALREQPAPIGGDVTWNFEKFLIDREGRVAARFEPEIEPEDARVTKRIETLLDTHGGAAKGGS